MISLAQTDDDMVWTHHAVLDREGKVHLFWTPGMQDITFEVQAETKGYIGLGFSPDGGMTNSDIVVGWVINNVPTLQDRYAIGSSEPLRDTQENYSLLGGSENATHTILRFRRNYETCDQHDRPITNDTMNVIYAYHQSDPIGDSLLVHQKAGHRKLYLTGFNNVLQKMTPDTTMFEMKVPNVTLPMGEKSFCWEKIFKFTPSTPNDAIIGFQPLWNNRTEAVIDHIWLYKCEVDDPSVWNQYTEERGYRCGMSPSLNQYTNCSQIIATAAVGSLGYALPATVGYSLKQNGGAIYFLLKIAYSGWQMQENLMDDSGMAVIYTSNPVTSPASTLTVGHHLGLSQIIPIDRMDFVTKGYCDAECTRTGIPPTGIFVYEIFLQAQHYGRQMTLKHLRNGAEMPLLAKDISYFGRSQVYRAFLEPVQILPGDSLVMECTYNTKESQSTILGGLQDDNETCLAYLNYYPRIELQSCLSSPPLSKLFMWLGTKETIGVEPMTYPEVSPNSQNAKMVEFLKNFNWVTGTKVPEFQNLVQDSYTSVCSSGISNATVSGPNDSPRIEHPYYESSKCGGVGTILESNTTVSVSEHDHSMHEHDHTGHDHDHSGHDHDHSGHDHDAHDGHDHGPVGQDVSITDHTHPMMGDQPGSGGMGSDHPNAVDSSSEGPGHGDAATSHAKHEGHNGASQLVGSFSILAITLLVVFAGKH